MEMRPAQTLFRFHVSVFLLPYFHPVGFHFENVKTLTVYLPASVHLHYAVQACSEIFPPLLSATTGLIPTNLTRSSLYHLDLMPSTTARTIDYCCV